MTHSLNAKPLPVCGARLLGRVMKVAAPPGGCALDVDASLRTARRPHADSRLRADARGRDGGVREELAARMKESPGGEAGASPKEKRRPEGLWTPRYYPKARDAQSKGLRCAAIVPNYTLST
jgi:hypothetical protein